MYKAAKWILAIAGAVVVLIAIAVIVLTMLIDVEKYKPQIEQQVAKATGRTFTLGGDLKPSFFPWIGIRLSDLHLGNPAGYKEKDFISVAALEVRVKLLPLLSRKIEVKRFVVNSPRIVLEKRKDGRGGWENIGKPAEKAAAPAKEQPDTAAKNELPIKQLMVGEFSITDGKIVWLDQTTGIRKEINDISLALTDVSFDKAIGVAFSALADQKRVQLKGTVGPMGTRPGKSPIPLDLAIQLLDQVDTRVAGRIDPSAAPLTFDLSISIAEFSPRQLITRLGGKIPLEPADEKALNAVALSFKLNGTPERVVVSGGKFKLDDAHADFSAQAGEFDKPNLKIDLQLDRIDLDRYLPPPAAEKTGTGMEKKPEASAPAPKTDYSPLRRMVLDARVRAGALKVKNARMQDIEVKISARNGMIRLDPLSLNMYTGNVTATGTVDVQKDQPATSLRLALNGIQAGPLVQDLMAKELIEGALAAEIDLNFIGDAPGAIRRTINGKGDLNFNDGAIVGIDLASMVRNVQTAFGLGQKPKEKPRTDFAELLLPFTITGGVFKTDASKLNSPLMRVLAAGSADLTKETLDFRVEPKFVATIQGQGDTSQRAGLMVPVIVSGTFESPKFKPDLAAILKQPLPDKEALQKMVPSKEKIEEDIQKLIPPKDQTQEKILEGVKGLLKGLPLGKE